MADDPSIGQKIRSLRRRATKKTATELRHAHAVALYAELPIGRLPTELLTDVLALAVEEDEQTTLKSLVEVCRLWENIVVASPRLNAIIKFPMSRKEIQRAVKRAKDHPLTVLYSHDRPTPTRRMEIFIEEACRHSRSWRILKVSSNFIGELDGLADVPTPLLEVCEVEGSVEDDAEINLFRGEAPLLRRLALTAVTITWDSAFFTSNLRSLEIITYNFQFPGAILALLAKTPRLVRLNCYTTDAMVDPGDVPLPSSRVVLDDLTDFCFKTGSRAIALAALSNIQMRPFVRVVASAMHVSPTEIPTLLATQFAHALASEGTRLSIEIDGWFIRIQVKSPLDGKPLFDADVSANLPESFPDITSIADLSTEGRPITLTVFRTFGGFGDERIDLLDSVLTVIDKLPDLDRLVLDGHKENRTAEIIEHLSCPGRRGGSSAEWSCPKLEVIEMHGCLDDKPDKLVRLIRGRSGDCHKTRTFGLHTLEREVTTSPVAIRQVVIGRGSAMDEASFSAMEQILGEGEVHWCWKMDCVGTCIESSRQYRGY